MLMDIESNKMIASGLSMPHSPRWYQDQLYVLESGAGSLATVDLETGQLTTVVELPGFTRGLDFIGRYAVVGLSQVRETAVFAGLPLTERVKDRQCGVYIVDIVEKRIVGFVVFSGEVREIFSVQILPSSFPAVLSLDDPLLRTTYSIPDEALKEVKAPAAEQTRLEQANLLYRQKKVDDAILAYKAYLEDFPDKSQARLNLAMIYLDTQQWKNAIDVLEFVIDKDPKHADAHNTQGRAWSGLHEWQKAKACFDKAIAIDQQYAEAHFNRSLILLSEGNYNEAWEAYEWRWQIPGNQPFSCAQPKWTGAEPLSALSDKTVLVHTEQSNADLIHFARFLPYLAKHCKKVIVLCHEPLRLFFKGVEGVDEVRLPGQLNNDSFDVFIPMLSLAGILDITLENLPSQTPYCTIPVEVVVPILETKAKSKKKVGLVWRSDNSQVQTSSATLEQFLPLIEDSHDVTFYSLQTSLTADELILLEQNNIVNLEPELVSYGHAGKLIEQLDLVLSVESSMAYLAASLGKNTCFLLGQNPNWIWQGGDFCHWYPNAKSIHAHTKNEWEIVIEKNQQELNKFVS